MPVPEKFRKEYMRAYAEKRKEELSAYHKKYRQDNREALYAASKLYWQRNKEQTKTVRAERGKAWREKNPEVKRELARKWQSMKIKTDPKFAAEKKIRGAILGAFTRRNTVKSERTEALLGCSISFAREHIKALFRPGMSWSNHGVWHIDHIIHCSSAKTIEELVALQHFTNLQPLWAIENILKGGKHEK